MLRLRLFIKVKTIKGALGNVHHISYHGAGAREKLFKQQIVIQLLVSIRESEELADPVGVEWNVLGRGKTTRKKEFLEVWQYIAFH
jgi:3-hydroxyisobutyrate dehydrogenase-like beta-hydroxyacid dehydrogenase